MLRTLLITVALLVFGSAEGFSGGIEPSMYLSLCRWEATDILVLTPTSIKATFRVAETIKGDAQPGDILLLKELVPPDDLKAFREQAERNNTPTEPPPAMEQGERMIVFLLRPGAKHESGSPSEPPSPDGWQPANFAGDLRFSAVWLRNGKAFAFVQASNPGATAVYDIELTEQELRHQIDEGTKLRASFDRALASPPNSVERALQLADLFRKDDVFASSSALKYLSTGGAAAADVLLELLSDQKLLNRHSDIVDALAKTGAGNAGLLRIPSEETQYWSSACGVLQPGWGDELGYSGHEKLRWHYNRARNALNNIRESNLTEDLHEVRNFHAVWIKCPAMGADETEQSEISKQFERLLRPTP